MSPIDPMDEDFRDSDISSLLGRVGGDAPATNAAYQNVLLRVRRVRRRRAIVTTLGAAVMIVAVGTLVVQNSSRRSDQVALDPRSAVVTTPDGSVVTTPEGVVVTVIIEPDDTTTLPATPDSNDVPSGGGTPGNSVPGSNSTTPSDPGTSDTSVPSGTNRPAGSTDDTTTTNAPTTPVTTVPTPTTTRPSPVTTVPTPTTTKPSLPPTTKPSLPPTTKPSLPPTTKPVLPSVPATVRPTIPPSSAPPVGNTVSRACGAGAIKVDVVGRAFVVGSLQTVVLPGFQATVASAKDNAIEVRFTSTQGRVTATLKVRITGNGIKDDCDIEIDKGSDSIDDDEPTSDDNNGARADD